MYAQYSDNIKIRPMRKEDLDAFHGEERPSDPTMRAWVGEKDGQPLVIGGIARALDARWYGFFDIKDDARQYSILIGRFAKMFVEEIKRSDVKYVYATIDRKEKNAVNWMERLGFHLDPRSKTFMRWKKEV